jgi:hypothetical protein
MVNRFLILAALLMALTAWCGITPAHATTPIPEAALIESGVAVPNSWRRMNVDSFPRTSDAAIAQCERDARHSASDRLTLAHCTTFRQKLEAGQCAQVAVADGQGYAYMNGPGRVYPGMVKRTGRADVAVRCDLGNGIYADWYNGQPGVSCFNVGIIIGIVPAIAIVDEPEPLVEQPVAPRCRMVTVSRQTQPSQGLFLPAVYLPGCSCCGPLYVNGLYIPSSGTDNVVTSYMVCN